ncbi:unnamed protein product [Amoebophrya sp. A120]|nr:unnamed protein product [Amoebophrya sp. A120]|eukprot:GSA120T00004078001.1
MSQQTLPSQEMPSSNGNTAGATLGMSGPDTLQPLSGDTLKSSSSTAANPQLTRSNSGSALSKLQSDVDYHLWIGDSIKLIEAFDPKKTTVDAHFDDKLGKNTRMSAARKKFTQQIFYCCIRYQKFLKLFVNAFLYKNPASAPRSDQTLYMILGCLFFFRYDELGPHELGKIILKSELSTPPALNALMDFIFTEEDLNNWVKVEWCKVYDMKYLEDEIIGKMQRVKPQLQLYLDQLKIIALGAGAAAAATSSGGNEQAGGSSSSTAMIAGSGGKTTKIQPFNLTKPKPRLVPQPEVISRVLESKPPPKTIYATNLEKVQAEKDERSVKVKEETFAKYNAEKDEFVFETAKRPAADDDSKARYVRDVEDVKYQECTFQPEIGKPLKDGHFKLEQIAEVKPNASSILREDVLVKKKQENEYNILMDYERGLRDSSGYYLWQYNQRVQDDIEEKCRVEQRKIEMQMAAEAAKEAMELQFQKNVLNAEQVKLQKAVQEKRKTREAIAEEEKKRGLCREVYDMRGRPRVQLDLVDEARKENAEEIRKAKAKMFEIKKADMEQEMEERKDLIRQIRAIVRVSTVTAEPYDPSEPPRHGILDEMSLAELHERYRIEKAVQERKRLEKRFFILDEKADKKKNLEAKAKNLDNIRAIARKEAAERHAKLKKEKMEQEEVQRKISEECSKEAARREAKKQEAKRKERNRVAKELKELNVRRQYLAHTASEQAEAKAALEQSSGKVKLTLLEKNLLEEQKANRRVRKEEKKIIKADRKNEAQEWQEMLDGVNVRLEASRKDDALLREEYRLERRDAHAYQRKVEAKLKTIQRKQLPYATRITDESIERGRAYRETHPVPEPLPP